MKEQDVNQIYLNKYLAEEESEDNYQEALTHKTKELEQRALTGEDFEEGMHGLTSKNGTLSMAIISKAMMKWLDSQNDHDARIVCASIEGLMRHARFMDSMEKASTELSK